MEAPTRNERFIDVTKRVHRIMGQAEKAAEKTNVNVLPIHLIIGALLERIGVCAELYLQFTGLDNILT
jgi:hypothetical protein